MKKLLIGFLCLWASVVFAQTFPVNNLTVAGTASFAVSPTAPTPSAGDSSTKLATTAFVAGHAQCPSILDNGGINNGTGDNTAAFAATAAVGPSGQSCVYFPPGTYAFGGNVAYTLPSNTASITILGAGAEVSKLVWAAGGGMTLNYVSAFNAVHVAGLSFLTGSAGAGSGLFLNQTNAGIPNPANTSLSDITNVVFRGSDGYSLTNYWANAVNELGVSNVGVYGVSISGASTAAGNGIVLAGTVANPSVVWNIANSNFNQLSQSIVYGTQVQGITVNYSNFVSTVGTATGIVVPASETNLDQLTVTASQFNLNTFGIQVNTGVANVVINGNLFIVPNAATGVDLEGQGITSITGNTFQSSGSSGANNGIVINTTANSWPATIESNVIQGMRGTGIFLKGPSQFVYVGLNGYQGNASNITNSGSNNVIVGQVLTNTTNNTPLSSTIASDATSISLPAGQWDVQCTAQFNPAGTTTVSVVELGVSTSGGFNGLGTLTQLQAGFATGVTQNISSPVVRIGLSTTTTTYCPVVANFGTSTMTVNGFIRAVAVNPQ